MANTTKDVTNFCCCRLQNEVDEVVGDKISVTFDDLGRLDYMSNVMTETLRMYPPGSGTSRENPADIQIEGHHIPKDSIVLVSIFNYALFNKQLVFQPTGKLFSNGISFVSFQLSFFVIHRLARYFPEPEEFNPDRWAADKDRYGVLLCCLTVFSIHPPDLNALAVVY